MSSERLRQQLMGADTETHKQTLSRGRELRRKQGGKDCRNQRITENNRKIQPTESTKQGSQGLTETETVITMSA